MLHKHLTLSPHSSCRPLLLQWPACRHSSRRQGSVSAARGDSWSEPDDTTKRALREAAEVLTEAQELARQQTLSDLMSSWTADTAAVQQQQQSPPAAAGSSVASTDPSRTANSATQQTDAAAAAAPGTAQVSSPAALEAFWCEQGLSQSEAQRLLKEVQADPQLSASCCNTQLLSQKLSSLSRVLPGVDVVRLVVRTPQLLMVSSSTAVQILVDLVNALPGCDVMDMVSRQPRLLLQDPQGLPQRLQAIITKLQALHPSHMERVVAGIIEENPELVLRMPYYLSNDVWLIDDLPIEIQNMMVLGDHGVGYLYKYWNNRLTERKSQSKWDAGTTGSSPA